MSEETNMSQPTGRKKHPSTEKKADGEREVDR
jgi:hypothetical protein